MPAKINLHHRIVTERSRIMTTLTSIQLLHVGTETIRRHEMPSANLKSNFEA